LAMIGTRIFHATNPATTITSRINQIMVSA
jgi:hypothetical protein